MAEAKALAALPAADATARVSPLLPWDILEYLLRFYTPSIGRFDYATLYSLSYVCRDLQHAVYRHLRTVVLPTCQQWEHCLEVCRSDGVRPSTRAIELALLLQLTGSVGANRLSPSARDGRASGPSRRSGTYPQSDTTAVQRWMLFSWLDLQEYMCEEVARIAAEECPALSSDQLDCARTAFRQLFRSHAFICIPDEILTAQEVATCRTDDDDGTDTDGSTSRFPFASVFEHNPNAIAFLWHDIYSCSDDTSRPSVVVLFDSTYAQIARATITPRLDQFRPDTVRRFSVRNTDDGEYLSELMLLSELGSFRHGSRVLRLRPFDQGSILRCTTTGVQGHARASSLCWWTDRHQSLVRELVQREITERKRLQTVLRQRCLQQAARIMDALGLSAAASATRTALHQAIVALFPASADSARLPQRARRLSSVQALLACALAYLSQYPWREERRLYRRCATVRQFFEVQVPSMLQLSSVFTFHQMRLRETRLPPLSVPRSSVLRGSPAHLLQRAVAAVEPMAQWIALRLSLDSPCCPSLVRDKLRACAPAVRDALWAAGVCCDSDDLLHADAVTAFGPVFDVARWCQCSSEIGYGEDRTEHSATG